MLHPSYTDLMKIVNSEVEEEILEYQQPLFHRYGNCKTRRQNRHGAEPLVYSAGKNRFPSQWKNSQRKNEDPR